MPASSAGPVEVQALLCFTKNEDVIRHPDARVALPRRDISHQRASKLENVWTPPEELIPKLYCT